MGIAAPGSDARARHPLCRRSARPRAWTTRLASRSRTSRRCRASSAPPTRCRTRTGATASRSAASPHSIRTRRRGLGGRRRLRHLVRRAQLLTGLDARDIAPIKKALAQTRCSTPSPPASAAPARCRLDAASMDAMLRRRRALGGRPRATGGRRSRAHRGARRDGRRRARRRVERAKQRQRDRDGHARLGQPLSRGAARRGGLRYRDAARAFGLAAGDVVVSIHCGSRGLGHQIGTEFLREMALIAAGERHRAARSRARLRADPLDARRALPRRDARGDQLRAREPADPDAPRRARSFAESCRDARLDAALRRLAQHVQGRGARRRRPRRRLFVHRKGATRAFGPGHRDSAGALRAIGQPVLIGGTMGTASYMLAGTQRRAWRRVRLGVPRRGPQHEPPRGDPPLAGAARRRRARGARHPRSAAPRCAASPRRRPAPTRTSTRSSTRPSARGPRAQGRAARADDLYQGLRRGRRSTVRGQAD